MKKALYTFVVYALLAVGSIALCNGFGASILPPLVYSIFGEEQGPVVGTIIIRLLCPIFMLAFIIPEKVRNKPDERAYLARTEGMAYDFAQDLREVLRDRALWINSATFAAVLGLLALFSRAPYWPVLIFIPIFVVLNPMLVLMLHRKWANGRMRK